MSLYELANQITKYKNAKEYVAYCQKNPFDNTTGDYEIIHPKQRRQ